MTSIFTRIPLLSLDDCEEDDDEEMVLFQFVFSSALNNEQRALVFDAMLAYGSESMLFRVESSLASLLRL